MGHQMFGKVEFKDEKNNFEAFIEFASDPSKEQDYIAGKIL